MLGRFLKCVRVQINKRSFEPFCVWILCVIEFVFLGEGGEHDRSRQEEVGVGGWGGGRCEERLDLLLLLFRVLIIY